MNALTTFPDQKNNTCIITVSIPYVTQEEAEKNLEIENNQTVPKVIVMGSSTASETTINTSTDSSNTIVTTMTATDGEATEDSLDMPDTIDIFSTDNVLDNSKIPNPLQPVPITPKTPATAKPQTPPTARNETKFTFEVHQASGSVDESTPKVILHGNSFVFETDVKQETKNYVDRLMEAQIDELKLEARRRNSYKQAAQNLDEIEVMEETYNYNSAKGNSNTKKLEVGKGKTERTSPKRRAERNLNSSPEESDSPKPKHRHKKTSRRTRSPSKSRPSGSGSASSTCHSGKFSYDERHIAKYRTSSVCSTTASRMTPPLPDLRVDFFSESYNGQRHHVSMEGVVSTHTLGVGNGTGGNSVSMEKRGSVCLNKCLKEVGAHLEQNCTSPINVTTNPLEHFSGRKTAHQQQQTQQATIVVQQPSVSVDHHTVSTVLLKNGGEFVTNVQQQDKLKQLKQKEENVKQLLDVANNLTLEEIHDFEMRRVSPDMWVAFFDTTT